MSPAVDQSLSLFTIIRTSKVKQHRPWSVLGIFVPLDWSVKGTVGQKNIYISHTNYRREMKLVPIIMHYCLLQFDALKFSLGNRLHGDSPLNFNFFNVNPQIWHRNRKVHGWNCLDTNFHNISDISLRVIRHRNCNECEFLTRKLIHPINI